MQPEMTRVTNAPKRHTDASSECTVTLQDFAGIAFLWGKKLVVGGSKLRTSAMMQLRNNRNLGGALAEVSS